MEKVWVYDFDKTIYDGDSSIDFFKFCLKKNIKTIKYFPSILFFMILYFFKFISVKKFKEHFFAFLKEFNNVDEIIYMFWKKNENKIYPFFLKDLEEKNRPLIYIISASPKFLLQEYTRKLKRVKLIATDMDKKTGKIKGENCKGEEKVKRLPNDIIIEKFYSDSYSDRFLANISNNAFITRNGRMKEWTAENFKKKK